MIVFNENLGKVLITSSGVLILSTRRLVGARPLNYVDRQVKS